MADGFIIYALPRSRTAWLTQFLRYNGWQCGHEQSIAMRHVDDIRAYFAQNDGRIGAVETSAAPGWRVIEKHVPNLRRVVIRRPVADVMVSLRALELGAIDWDLMQKKLDYLDRMLAQIAGQPGVLSIHYADLMGMDACAALFEHCLGYAFDRNHWLALACHNIQIDLPAMFAHYQSIKEQVDSFQSEMWSELRSGREQLVIGEETWDSFVRDAKSLIDAHYSEVGAINGLPFNPNYALGSLVWNAGGLQITGARLAGKLVAYLLFLIEPDPESIGILNGVQLPIFVQQDHRGRIGKLLHDDAIHRLKARGVQQLILRAGVRGCGPKLASLYQRLGATEDARIFRLWVGA